MGKIVDFKRSRETWWIKLSIYVAGDLWPRGWLQVFEQCIMTNLQNELRPIVLKNASTSSPQFFIIMRFIPIKITG